MAASVGPGEGASSLDDGSDPFVSRPTIAPPASTRPRYSHFDTQLFALGPGASPEQAQRVLEAHLADTERRLEETGKLGNALVQQRMELVEKLKEVEKLKAEGELTAELRQRLVEIEKEFHDVARESARAFLPKQRIPSNEAAAAAGSPFVPDAKAGGRVSIYSWLLYVTSRAKHR